MKLLIVEMYRNGLNLANRLAQQPEEVEAVYLVTDTGCPDLWKTDRLHVIEGDMKIHEIVDIAKRVEADLVVNFNSVYGCLGLCEALSREGIRWVGSSQAFSDTEINKKDFKIWLQEEGFRTPEVYYIGMLEDVRSKIHEFIYPLVIKPDKQVGLPVRVCEDQQKLQNYLTESMERIPSSRFGLLFLIEQFIPIVEHMHGGYMLCNSRGFLTTSVRMPLNGNQARSSGECMWGLFQYPRNDRFKEEIGRFIQKISRYGDAAVAAVQCGITSDGDLYFMENNARPGTYGGLRAFNDPLACLRCLDSGDHMTLEQHIEKVRDRIVVGVGLLHEEDSIAVDVDRLNRLDGFRFVPNSIQKNGDSYISRRNSFPSFLMMEGSDVEEVVMLLDRNLATIRSTGNYLKIDPNTVRKLLSS